MCNVGTAKYVVNYCTGKKHQDGSDFYDIAIFKNKRKKDRFLQSLAKVTPVGAVTANYQDPPQVWWDYIQGNDEQKYRYFLRNWSGMGLTVERLLEFFKSKGVLRGGANEGKRYQGRPQSVCYWLCLEARNIVFRVDPNTPGRPPRPFPSICVTNPR
jgi:hypothetical protein